MLPVNMMNIRNLVLSIWDLTTVQIKVLGLWVCQATDLRYTGE